MADKNDWKEREAGALWAKETPNGKKFLSGTINGQRVSVWKNDFFEEGGNKPMFRVYRDDFEEKPKQEAVASSTADDDIPF